MTCDQALWPWEVPCTLASVSSLWLGLPAACCRDHSDDHECTLQRATPEWSRKTAETGRPGHSRTGSDWLTNPTAGRPAEVPNASCLSRLLINVHSFKHVTALPPCLGTGTLTVHVPTTHHGEKEPGKGTENHFISKVITGAQWLKFNEAETLNSLNECLRGQKKWSTKSPRKARLFFAKYHLSMSY